jgi:hypothetical protein
MTAATAASVRLGLSFVSLASRAPGESSRRMALPTCQASRLSPECVSSAQVLKGVLVLAGLQPAFDAVQPLHDLVQPAGHVLWGA